jgi:Flp pilus assembly protein TadG
MILRNPHRRSAATAVEMAVIAPAFLLLIFILVIGGLGMFRYNQVAHLAREGARYASVHGRDWANETRNPAATPQTIYEQAILPNAIGLDRTQLSYSVVWDRSNAPKQSVPPSTAPVRNYVYVTVSYQWLPDNIFGGGTLTSTSKMPMCH